MAVLKWVVVFAGDGRFHLIVILARLFSTALPPVLKIIEILTYARMFYISRTEGCLYIIVPPDNFHPTEQYLWQPSVVGE